MCIYSEQRLNKKYTATKKNGGIIPPLNDIRQKYTMIPCGKCWVCKRKKSREWQVRLAEEIKHNPNCKKVTLTFNTQELKKLSEELKNVKGYELDNQICKLAIKRFRERWRKKYGRSIKHWLVTELGHGKTEHVHIHGFLWIDNRYELKNEFMKEVEKIWKYGWVDKGKINISTGEREATVYPETAIYYTKYINKIDEQHKEYKPIILTSGGIGKDYLKTKEAQGNKFNEEKTYQLYTIEKGGAIALPEYYRKKIYTEEEREKLTTHYLNSGKEYLAGKEITGKSEQEIFAMKKQLQEKNKRMGYGDRSKNWERITHENEKRRKIHKERFKKT